MESSLKRVVNERRKAILERWTEQVLASYPADTGKFLREQRDPFHNPVGRTIAGSVGPLLDAAVAGVVDEAAMTALDAILRVRAVQDLSPSTSLGFLLKLRDLVRSEIAGLLGADRTAVLEQLDRGADELVLAGFEVYVGCREDIWRIRTEEIQRRSTKVLERLDLWRAIRNGDDAETR